MDFILKKIENNLMLYEPGTYDYITYLRMRIEYCLFFCLGFLWKNFESLPPEKQYSAFNELTNLSIGSVVSLIRELDRKEHEIIKGKRCSKLLDNYPSIRNSKMGHGYELGDAIASTLTPFYNELISEIPILKDNCDIIVVRQYNSTRGTYEGFRFPADQFGQGVRWTCPKELITPVEKEFPRTYVFYKENYYKISPFVFVDPVSKNPMVFSSLAEKIVGKVKMCPLFSDLSGNDGMDLCFNELVFLSKDDKYRQSSLSNGTIMNKFVPNYAHYFDVGFTKLIEDFLFDNRAYVSATLWGHGGVGKTACIQKICHDLFNRKEKRFSYIVFVTAKDRLYNSKTGEIDQNEGNIRLYSEVIQSIARVIFAISDSDEMTTESLEEYEKRISQFDDSLLIVIDDYETFEDSEKEKISRFLSTLDVRYHKAIITTRNKRFVIGEAISCNELDTNNTMGLISSIVDTQFPEHKPRLEHLLQDKNAIIAVHTATSGRPVFIYQFVYIFLQRGYDEKLIKEIRKNPNAQEFLYGRIFEYLSKNAQYLFATISTLADADLRFDLNVLEYALSKVIVDHEQFEESLEEISNQKVIELLNEAYGRIYSQELLQIMTARYKEYPDDFRSTVKNLLDTIGGKIISGSIYSAMLDQADKSRAFGNEKQTIEKYRRILNDKKTPFDIKKIAVKHLVDYLSNARLNTQAAISVMEEYLNLFANDSEVHSIYIYMLWSQGKTEKEKAVNKTREFFSTGKHKKNSPEYLSLFALGTGYCIDFDLHYREYPIAELKKKQFTVTLNEYGKLLFSYVKSRRMKGKPELFHNIRVALVQTVKLCEVLGKEYHDMDKVTLGLEICRWMRDSHISEPFLNQIIRLEGNLNKFSLESSSKYDVIPSTPEPKVDSALDNLRLNEEIFWDNGKQYKEGDVVEVKVTRIAPYGVFAMLDSDVTGMIHISEIANRYIADINKEFSVGDVCYAKIISIDIEAHKIDLSTVGYHT